MVISGRKKKFLVTNRGMLAHLRYLKSHVTAMDFYLQTNMLWNMDLSIEVLNIDFGQGDAKISEVIIGGQYNIYRRAHWFAPNAV